MLTTLTKMDELIKKDHCYLDESDECVFFGEYFPSEHPSWREQPINSLIHNIKKCPSQKSSPYYSYKTRDINRVGETLKKWDLKSFIIVPVPPSKLKTDPLYDDRLIQILDIGAPYYKELIVLKESRETFHESSGKRLNPDELKEKLEIDEDYIRKNNKPIVIFDDVITTGSHYKAIKNMILSINPNTIVYGLFIARRKPYLINSQYLSSYL